MKIIKKAKERTAEDNRQLRDTVTNIIDHVCREGDQALREYSEKFDGFVRDAFRVSREERRVILRLDLSPEEIIFGLGESVRGINKRGHTYRSWNMDITPK